MKKLIFIALSMLVLCHACIVDDSTLPDKEISEITISAKFDSLSVDVGVELVYEPEIEQTGDLSLTYEWSYQAIDKKGNRDSLKFLSDERILRYQFKKLGNYDLRLKVSNEHGSAFKKYALSVRAFDEGLMVLSEDADQHGRVSFMRKLSPQEVADGKEETFNTDIFAAVNPGFPLNDPADMAKIGSDIFLLSRGDNLVYRIDGQTFDLYNITEFDAEFPNIHPDAIIGMDRSVTTYMIWAKDGNCVNVDYNSDIAFPCAWEAGVMDKMYCKITGAPIPPSTYITNMKCYYFFLNYEESKLYYMYNYPLYGYPYRTFSKSWPDRELINVMMDDNLFVHLVTRSKTEPNSIDYKILFVSNNGVMNEYFSKPLTAGQLTLTRESSVQYNTVYKNIFYTSGNKMYRWVTNYWQPQVPPQEPVITLEGKEITCFEFSPDWKQLYLGVYDPLLPDLKGCVYVYDADKRDAQTGELVLLEKYEGIADRPIKVFWKNNRK